MKKGTKNILAVAGVFLLILGGLMYFDVINVNDQKVKPMDVTSGGSQTSTGSGTAQLAGTCTEPLGDDQTLSFAGWNADKRSTAVTGISTVVFTDEAKGEILNGNVTIPGNSYSAISTKSGFLKAYKQVTTSCTEKSPQVKMFHEEYDSTASVTVYNVGGRTANAVNTQNQTLTASSPVTLDIEITPSALYKHIGGGVPEGQTGKFAVFFNYTNSSDWDPSGFALEKSGPWGTGSCVKYSGPTPTYTGVVVAGFVCEGDFSGTSTAIHKLHATIKPSSIYANGPKSVLSVNIVPVDYYQHTISGALETGPVKDDGSAIQTPIQKGIGLA